MKRPSFQFYPADWQANSNLRRCTHEEKGIWIDVLCLLHDSNEYGILRWTLKEIAQAVGCTVGKLQSIVDKGILKGNDSFLTDPFVYIPRSGRKNGEPVTLVPTQPGPIWYSSRMVKDEYVRQTAGKSTRFGAQKDDNPPSANHSPRHSPSRRHGAEHGEGKGDGSTSTSTSTSIKSTTTTTARATLVVDNSAAIHMHSDWRPTGDCVQACFDQGVTPEFIDEYLPRWRMFWIERGDQRATWNAVFLEQCAKEFDKALGIPVATGRSR